MGFERAMHEMVYAERILALLEAAAKEHRATKVNGIVLQIGRYAGIDPSSLCFCLESISVGTVLEGAVLRVHSVYASGGCPACGPVEPGSNRDGACPRCGQTLNTDAQYDILLREIELDVPDR